MQKSGLDTSPIITDYGYVLPNGNPFTKPLVVSQDGCITDYYDFPAQTYTQTMTACGTCGSINLFIDDSYKDFWGWNSPNVPNTRKVINIGTNRIRFGLYTAMIDDAYAFLVETGQIFFAGKNTSYYGHRNISELS